MELPPCSARPDAKIIGTIGFKGPPARVEDRIEVEVGYGLVPSARGAGLATEALAPAPGRLVPCRAA